MQLVLLVGFGDLAGRRDRAECHLLLFAHSDMDINITILITMNVKCTSILKEAPLNQKLVK